jgi:hypothetical protein
MPRKTWRTRLPLIKRTILRINVHGKHGCGNGKRSTRTFQRIHVNLALALDMPFLVNDNAIRCSFIVPKSPKSLLSFLSFARKSFVFNISTTSLNQSLIPAKNASSVEVHRWHDWMYPSHSRMNDNVLPLVSSPNLFLDLLPFWSALCPSSRHSHETMWSKYNSFYGIMYIQYANV